MKGKTSEERRDRLFVGKRYRVSFRPADRPRMKPRVIEGRYMGWSQFWTKHEFDLRPEYGTTGIKPEDIVSCEELTK